MGSRAPLARAPAVRSGAWRPPGLAPDMLAWLEVDSAGFLPSAPLPEVPPDYDVPPLPPPHPGARPSTPPERHAPEPAPPGAPEPRPTSQPPTVAPRKLLRGRVEEVSRLKVSRTPPASSDAAAKPPVRASGPGEGVPREPGGFPVVAPAASEPTAEMPPVVASLAGEPSSEPPTASVARERPFAPRAPASAPPASRAKPSRPRVVLSRAPAIPPDVRPLLRRARSERVAHGAPPAPKPAERKGLAARLLRAIRGKPAVPLFAARAGAHGARGGGGLRSKRARAEAAGGDARRADERPCADAARPDAARSSAGGCGRPQRRQTHVGDAFHGAVALPAAGDALEGFPTALRRPFRPRRHTPLGPARAEAEWVRARESTTRKRLQLVPRAAFGPGGETTEPRPPAARSGARTDRSAGRPRAALRLACAAAAASSGRPAAHRPSVALLGADQRSGRARRPRRASSGASSRRHPFLSASRFARPRRARSCAPPAPLSPAARSRRSPRPRLPPQRHRPRRHPPRPPRPSSQWAR